MLTISSGLAQNLVTNGSFEQVQIGPPYQSADPAAVPGWTHAGSGEGPLWHVGFTDCCGSVTIAGDGLQFVTLGGGYGETNTAGWSQVLNGLIPGATYQLNFKMASEDTAAFSGLASMSLTVEFLSGSSTSPQTFTAAAAPTNYWSDWESKTMNFTATSNQAQLVFTARTAYDVGLDSVSVTFAPLQIDLLAPLTNGQVHLRVNGPPGTNYTILASTDLHTSNSSWLPLFTSNSITGTFEFVDTQATNSFRFYRAVSQ